MEYSLDILFIHLVRLKQVRGNSRTVTAAQMGVFVGLGNALQKIIADTGLLHILKWPFGKAQSVTLGEWQHLATKNYERQYALNRYKERGMSLNTEHEACSIWPHIQRNKRQNQIKTDLVQIKRDPLCSLNTWVLLKIPEWQMKVRGYPGYLL